MNIFIPIVTGSEFRQFYLSRIASILIDRGHTIYTMIKDNDTTLTQELLSVEPRANILAYQDPGLNRSALSYIQFCLDYHDERINQRWRYSTPISLSKGKKILLSALSLVWSSQTIRDYSLRWEQRLIKRYPIADQWRELYDTHCFDIVVVNVSRFLYAPQLLLGALQRNIPVEVVYHSNKEVIAQPRVSFDYAHYGVWSRVMAEQLVQRNPHILPSRLDIIGNSHFTYLDREPKISRELFCQRFDIKDCNAKIILYTAAGVIIKNEMLIVDRLAQIARESRATYKIIVRKNPMDTTSRWNEYFNGRTDICIQQPAWVMNTESSLNYALDRDLDEFNALLTYSDFCVNIPSTVTLECAIKRCAVVNIAYNVEGVECSTNSGQIDQFWNAGFYHPFHNVDFVKKIESDTEFESTVLTLMSGNDDYKDYDTIQRELLEFEIADIQEKVVHFIVK